jgi:hypothetical protein
MRSPRRRSPRRCRSRRRGQVPEPTALTLRPAAQMGGWPDGQWPERSASAASAPSRCRWCAPRVSLSQPASIASFCRRHRLHQPALAARRQDGIHLRLLHTVAKDADALAAGRDGRRVVQGPPARAAWARGRPRLHATR